MPRISDLGVVLSYACRNLSITGRRNGHIFAECHGKSATDNGIPVVGYDRLIDDARAYYLTFDNVEVGRMQARAVLEKAVGASRTRVAARAHKENQRIVEFIKGIQAEVGKKKIDFPSNDPAPEMYEAIKDFAIDDIRVALDTDDKRIRDERL